MFLRFVGWDGFVTSKDVVACLRDAGVDIAEEVKSKGDLAKVQAAFNAWAEGKRPALRPYVADLRAVDRRDIISRNDDEGVVRAHAACKPELLRRLRFPRPRV